MSREARLVLGPILRYVGQTDATVWVETDAECEVEVRPVGARPGEAPPPSTSPTFEVDDHHYALVIVEGLAPGEVYEYEVHLDAERVWPEAGSPFPPPEIRTLRPDGEFVLAYGSCRVAVPNEEPYTLARGKLVRGGLSGKRFERDALCALSLRVAAGGDRPDALLLLGDQIYADEVSPGVLEYIRNKREPGEEPEDQVSDFDEYTLLYHEAWSPPELRWLFSTVPSAMIFDDHDVHDDWNTSDAWLREIRSQSWWHERIIGAFMSYWVYQHLGNLSPRELAGDSLFAQVRSGGEVTETLRDLAYSADREVEENRWSFYRDFGKVRLIVMDSRAGRVLKEGNRAMLDAKEWSWVEERASGEFNHFLFGTSLPFALPPALHHFEAANEVVCAGAWGGTAARLAEKVRQAVDLEHWPAFHASFTALAELLRSVASGERSGGIPPASIAVLSGDVHHGYLARLDFEGAGSDEVRGERSPVYQSVASPLRNPLGVPEHLGLGSGWSPPMKALGRALSRLAGVKEGDLKWGLVHEKPWFDNHITTFRASGREAIIRVEKTVPERQGPPGLYPLFEKRIT